MAKNKAAELDKVLDDAIEGASRFLPKPNLSIGCDLFNLAVGDSVDYAVGPGRYIWFQGASSSGKSFLTLALLAEAARNPYYDKHQLAFFDMELGATFDMQKFFGRRAADRIRVERCDSQEHFYDRISELQKQGPLVAVLDSWDALSPESRLGKIEEQAKLRAEGKEIKGDYGMDHAKIHSRRLPIMVDELAKSQSIFIGISQQRDNIDAGLYGPKNKVSGGRALRYWASVEIETALAAKIEKEINGKKRTVGSHIRVKIAKNRISGKDRSVELVFIPGYGIDNTGSSIDWLVAEKYLAATGGRITSPWYDKSYTREQLIARIEEDGKENELKQFLLESWQDLESKLRVERKPRYE